MNEHVSDWFRGEYKELVNEGKTGDALKVTMYDKGFAYLEHVMETPMHWKGKQETIKDVLKMIEYVQGWIDRDQIDNEANIHKRP